MRKKLMWAAGVAAVALLAMGYAETVRATPSFGFTSTTFALGRFGDIDVSNHLIREFGDSTPKKDLGSRIRKPRDHLTSSSRTTSGRLGELAAGTRIPATA